MRMKVMMVALGLLVACDEEAPQAVPGGPVTAEKPEGSGVVAPGTRDGALPQVSDEAPDEGGAAKPAPRGLGEGTGDVGAKKKEETKGDEGETAKGTAGGDEATDGDAAKPKSFDQECPAADAGLDAIGLGKIQITSDVKDKEPIDTIDRTFAGEKVWAYLEVKNLTDGERCVAVIFEVGGKKRASLTLDVGHSPRWRTWAHVTIQKSEVGKDVVITVQDDQGHELSKKTLPVVKGERAQEEPMDI